MGMPGMEGSVAGGNGDNRSWVAIKNVKNKSKNIK